MTADGIGNEGMGSEAAYRLKVEMKHVTAVGIGMNHEFADGNSSSTGQQSAVMSVAPIGAEKILLRNVTLPNWIGLVRFGYLLLFISYFCF